MSGVPMTVHRHFRGYATKGTAEEQKTIPSFPHRNENLKEKEVKVGRGGERGVKRAIFQCGGRYAYFTLVHCFSLPSRGGTRFGVARKKYWKKIGNHYAKRYLISKIGTKRWSH